MAGQIEIVVTEEFKKAFSKLPSDIKNKIRKQLRFLQSNPAHPSLKMHKLNGEWEFYPLLLSLQ
jgi:mRNA-degrading endonuclease YafQ of YafQ-DinJ toxin-antitoxin module